MLPSPPPLLSVVLLFRYRREFAALPHVVQSVSTFLDSAVEMEFSQACRLNSVKLLERIWNSCSPESEPSPADAGPGHGGHFSRRRYLRTDEFYNRYEFFHGMRAAVKHEELDVVKWLFDHFKGGVVDFEAVEHVCEHGKMEMLEYFRENGVAVERGRWEEPLERADGKHVIYWGREDMAKAVANKQPGVVLWLGRHTLVHRNIDKVVGDAVSNSDVMTLEWVERNYDVDFCQPELMKRAAYVGQLDIMEWLLEQGCDLCMYKVARLAINRSKSRLDMVKWLIENNLAEAIYLLELAASRGSLEIAKYIYDRYWEAMCEQKHFPLNQPSTWEKWEMPPPSAIADATMRSAIFGGHFSTAKWLFETFNEGVDLFEREPWINAKVIDLAAAAGQLELVKYLHGLAALFAGSNKRKRGATMSGSGPLCSSKAIDYAAQNGHLHIIQWLHLNRTEGCTVDAMNDAAERGRLNIVTWLHAHRAEGCTVKAMDTAARNGHLEVVQWLHEHRREGCTTKAMDEAAEMGHLNTVKWLHENRNEGCTTEAMDGAAKQGHLDVVKWLHVHRKEGCTTSAMDDSATYGHLEVVKWLHFNRTEGCTTRAMDGAALEGKLPLLRWLHHNRSEGCTTDAIDRAVGMGWAEVVAFLLSHRKEGCTSKALDKAAGNRNLDLLLRLHAQSDAGCTHQAFLFIENGGEASDETYLYKWLAYHYPSMEHSYSDEDSP